MFDPNYIPEVVDVVLSYDHPLHQGRTEVSDIVRSDISEGYSNASFSLRYKLQPRILLERDIWEAGSGVIPTDQTWLSRNSVLILHGKMDLSGIDAVPGLMHLGFRAIILYGAEKESYWLNQMASALGIDDILEHELDPAIQFCALASWAEGHNVISEMINCNGRIFEYFRKMKEMKDRIASGGIPHV